MATVTGPAMSFDASGTIGGSLVYSKWKGRNYVRRHAIPANPKTPAQRVQRAMMRFLSTTWSQIPALSQGEWVNLAQPDAISPVNAFTRFNLNKWTQDAGPQLIPVGVGGTFGTVATWSAAGGNKQATLQLQLNPLNSVWAAIIYASLTPAFNPQKSDAHFIVYMANTAVKPVVITKLTAGTWRFRVTQVQQDGTRQTHATEINAVVT